MPLSDLVSGLPPALEAAVSKCLEKDPRHRFATVHDLALALASFGPARSKISLERISGLLKKADAAESAPVVTPEPEVEKGGLVDTAQAASWGQSSSQAPAVGRRRSSSLVAGAIAVAVAGIGLVTYAFTHNAAKAGAPGFH